MLSGHFAQQSDQFSTASDARCFSNSSYQCRGGQDPKARLAVDVEYLRNGLGRVLIKDALLRALQAADIAGIRVALVHAKDAQAREWYASWDFESSMTDPYHLFYF